MGIIENFLVNTNNFESIIQTLMNEKEVPAKITDSYFKSLGFQNPSDLLVIHLLKGLQILEEDGSVTPRFSELRHPDTTRMAIAKGVVEGYEDLFKKNPEVHKLEKDELQELFSEIFQGKKTDLILKYMTNTFTKLVSYAGLVNMENVLADKTGIKDSASALEVVQEVAEIHKNGKSTANGTASTQNEVNSDISFEELVGLTSYELTDSVPPSQQAKNSEKDGGKSDSENTAAAKPEFPASDMPVPEPSENNAADSEENIFESQEETVPEPQKNITEPKKSMPEPQQKSQDENFFEDFFGQEDDNGSDQILDETKDENSPPVPKGKAIKEADEKVQKAFIKKANLLYKLNRHEDALPALEAIITYFDQSGEAFLKEAVSKAIIRRAMILCKQQKYDQALPALDKVISKFANSDNKEFYEQASAAMLYKAQIMETTKQLDQALPLFNSIIERLGKSTNPKIKDQVDNIFLKRLDILLVEGKDDDVLLAADQLIERFKNSGENLQYLEEAMFRKAEILEKMNKDEEALLAYSEFLEKFGNNVTAL